MSEEAIVILEDACVRLKFRTNTHRPVPSFLDEEAVMDGDRVGQMPHSTRSATSYL